MIFLLLKSSTPRSLLFANQKSGFFPATSCCCQFHQSLRAVLFLHCLRCCPSSMPAGHQHLQGSLWVSPMGVSKEKFSSSQYLLLPPVQYLKDTFHFFNSNHDRNYYKPACFENHSLLHHFLCFYFSLSLVSVFILTLLPWVTQPVVMHYVRVDPFHSLLQNRWQKNPTDTQA